MTTQGHTLLYTFTTNVFTNRYHDYILNFSIINTRYMQTQYFFERPAQKAIKQLWGRFYMPLLHQFVYWNLTWNTVSTITEMKIMKQLHVPSFPHFEIQPTSLITRILTLTLIRMHRRMNRQLVISPESQVIQNSTLTSKDLRNVK